LAVSPRHLVVLPLPDATDATEALAAIGRLERSDLLEVLGVAVVERRGDGTVQVALVPRQDSAPIDVAAWTWLLSGILEDHAPAGRGQHPGAPLGGAVFSVSFLDEVREVVARAGRSLALVVAGLDAAAAVSELRGVPGAKLVYGVLPEPVLERMLTRPARGGEAPSGH
jgi:uncharacterized membrane protein